MRALFLFLLLLLLLLLSEGRTLVRLRVQHKAELDALSASVSNPRHSQWLQFPSPQQLHDRFAPTVAEVNQVRLWLRNEGHYNITLVNGLRWAVSTTTEPSPATIPPHLASIVSSISNSTHKRNIHRFASPAGGNGADQVVARTLSGLYDTPNPRSYTIQNTLRNLSIMVVSENDAYLPSDLNVFAQLMGVPSPVNVTNYLLPEATSNVGESTLDMLMVIEYSPQGTQFLFLNNPSTNDWDGWCETIRALPTYPSVVTYSWGEEGDAGYTPQVDARACLQILATGGVTVVAASGDDGSCGFANTECSASLGFTSSFPADCAYVTAVGATSFNIPSTTTTQFADVPLCYGGHTMGQLATEFGFNAGSLSSTVMPCITVNSPPVAEFPPPAAALDFYNGGGFSVTEAMPSWQATAVNAYLARTNIPFPSPIYYNVQNRAYPDVSAFGMGSFVISNSTLIAVGGTSQSSPIFASLVLYLVDWSLVHLGQPLGNLNPLLYMMAAECAACFNGVITGNNNGTETISPSQNPLGGFSASPGWNAVAGLGSPNIGNMITFMQDNFPLPPPSSSSSTGTITTYSATGPISSSSVAPPSSSSSSTNTNLYYLALLAIVPLTLLAVIIAFLYTPSSLPPTVVMT